MPTYEVTAPDGKTYDVTAPEGASQAQVLAYAKSQFGKQQAAPVGTGSRMEAFAAGVSKPIESLAKYGEQGVNALLGTDLNRFQQGAARNDAVRASNPNNALELAGNVAGTLPLLAIPGGPVAGTLAQGAVGGALLSDGDTAGEVAADAGLGMLGAGIGGAAVSGVRRAIAPVVSKGVQALTDAGIRMTPGQAGRATGTKLGEMMGEAEDKLMSLPFTGAVIESGRKIANEDFNRALLSRPLKAIGQAFPKGAPVGHEGISAVGDVLSAGYNSTLAGVRGVVDQSFAKAINGIGAKTSLPAAEKAQLQEILQREVTDILKGNYTGKQIGKVRDRLDKLAATLGKSVDNPYARDVGEAVGQARAAVLAMAQRQNPGVAAKIKALDKGWAELVRVERAAVNTADGVITPQGYQAAIKGADRSVRKRAASRGEAMGQDFAKDASKALPGKVPNSGTFDRMAANSIYTVVGAGVAPLAMAARGATAVVTRNPGPIARRASNALIPLRPAAALTGPALLLRPDE